MKIKKCPCCNGVPVFKIKKSKLGCESIRLHCKPCGLSTGSWMWGYANSQVRKRVIQSWNKRYKKPVSLFRVIRPFLFEPFSTLAQIKKEIINRLLRIRIGFDIQQIDFDVIPDNQNIVVKINNEFTAKFFKHIPII